MKSSYRFFCSDVHMHKPFIKRLWPATDNCLHTYIGQEPLDSSYFSILCYVVINVHKKLINRNCLEVRHRNYTSIWSQHYPVNTTENAEMQSDNVIASLQGALNKYGLSLEENVYRTWYYIRDIDNNYAGMVHSRTKAYEAAALNPDTHFIASTGIEALAHDPHILVALRSHSIKGLQPSQVTYLKALEFLSPTHAYGVNFERATRITYGDRIHCHISGTASIDAAGQVVHKGDVVKQCERSLLNIEALLKEGSMNLSNLVSAIVYLRDGQEYHRVAPVIRSVLPSDCALIFTRAPVCRPDWLIEIEGEAISPCVSPYPNFA